ncbi:Hypothetical protein R9X50_00191100 [Acrodontium crateriforme]|uniref:Alpha-L-rhamnosidase six-hairpin glycosidase domain-containing protein n=1 Tax=Acrodontium crateriforme TaxID=150365 RepID=A0AAQ3M0I7_9PEZI|nr:Hypothetical protein R9X50_00191100 [Acrodontium crateriforme]
MAIIGGVASFHVLTRHRHLPLVRNLGAAATEGRSLVQSSPVPADARLGSGRAALQYKKQIPAQSSLRTGRFAKLIESGLTINMDPTQERKIIGELNANWIWVPDWIDSSSHNTAGRIVEFYRQFHLQQKPTQALLHFSADTRYKLVVNNHRVAVGPTRSGPQIWYYDTVDISPFLEKGDNEITFVVIRYFASSRGAMPFERTSFPGLTVSGIVESEGETVNLASTQSGWSASINDDILFPTGLLDDVFLHISERKASSSESSRILPRPYNFKTLNGDLLPWRLQPRCIPIAEQHPVGVNIVRECQSSIPPEDWASCLRDRKCLSLPANSTHSLVIQADVHSTAFLKWTFKASTQTHVTIKSTYSEGYEKEPRSYPFFRTKADRLDATNSLIIGPFDEVKVDVTAGSDVVYEPFWFRTFRLIKLDLSVGPHPVDFVSFEATQTNYPLDVKATWSDASDTDGQAVWDVSIRTIRNCLFDGYSDCPFYEQLQYSMDSRAVGLFHYLLSGDDRLMRQTITLFASSVTPEGLTMSRFPSHTCQLIAAFPLYWILQICDHHLYFGDSKFSRSFLPRIDGILEFFNSYIDEKGLVSGLPDDVWQFVDWVTTWGATDEHPDKGVPSSGRKSNLHTYFSLLLIYVLDETAKLAQDVGRPGHAEEYKARAACLRTAVRTHCYDGQYFTDSTVDIADASAYSQHCQVFAVLSGTATPDERTPLLKHAFGDDSAMSKCSYMMMFYAFRAFALAGDEVYESFWQRTISPWRRMLSNNLSTWEEDDVRQRSDCHAWGSVPVYEYCTEIAGIQPVAPGSSKIRFQPRLGLSTAVEAKVALGRDNVATVSWTADHSRPKVKTIDLRLKQAVDVVSRLPGGQDVEHGLVDRLTLEFGEA